jgi:hypothetical protein
LKIFSGGYTPGPPLKRGGGHEEGKEGWGEEREGGKGRRGGKRVVPPRFKLVPTRFPWAGYGPGPRAQRSGELAAEIQQHRSRMDDTRQAMMGPRVRDRLLRTPVVETRV